MLLFIFKSVLLSSAVGASVFVFLMVIRPLTRKHFSVFWHYVTVLSVMILMIYPIRINLPEKAMNDSRFTAVIEEEKAQYKFLQTAESAETSSSVAQLSGDGIMLIFSYLWLGICTSLILKNEISYFIFRRRLFKNTTQNNLFLLPNGKTIPVRKGEIISSPMVCGIISPVLFLPINDFSDKELSVIVSHETVHLQRRDLIIKRLMSLSVCIHFFNPFVYLMKKQISLDCEISCDLSATKLMSEKEKESYMLSLLSVVSKCSFSAHSFAAGINAGSTALKRRFTEIKLSRKISKKAKIVSAVISAVLILSSFFVSGVLASDIEKPVMEQTEISAQAQHNKLQSTESVASLPSSDKESVQEKPCAPCQTLNIASPFGGKRNHNGIDIFVSRGSDVFACENALVSLTEESNAADGSKIILTLSDGKKLIYTHLDEILIKEGSSVAKGEIIAKSGATGAVTGPCLHFSVMKDGKYVDPINYLG